MKSPTIQMFSHSAMLTGQHKSTSQLNSKYVSKHLLTSSRSINV